MIDDPLFPQFEKFWKTPMLITKYDPMNKYSPCSMAMNNRRDAAFLAYKAGIEGGGLPVKNDLSWVLGKLGQIAPFDTEVIKVTKEIRKRNGL